jgi:hypothetical protein
MNLLVLIGSISLGFTAAFTLWAAAQGSIHGGQSMKDSILESWTNIAIGFGINYVANILVLPLAGFEVGMSGAFWIGAIFTGISVLRSFLLRRWFNFKTVRATRHP